MTYPKIGRKKIPILTRMWKHTKIDGECWRWTGSKVGSGYGHTRFNGDYILVHRLSASIHLGFDLESKSLILHKLICPHKDCWRPEHLYVGNHRDNMIDALDKGTRSPYWGNRKSHA